MASYSQAYLEYRRQGPFPGRVDPWSEIGRYFHPIHDEMISHFLGQIQDPLEALGYVAGRETSLQIAENREPDVHVWQRDKSPVQHWNYAAAAEKIRAEPGEAITWVDPELDALYIKTDSSGQLVTVVEIISPSNKVLTEDMHKYQERRLRLNRQGVNVVEIDLTRSVKRLLDDELARGNPYHIAVYLPGQIPRVIAIALESKLKRIALPLRGEVIPLELQAAYSAAYLRARTAVHLYNEGRYTVDDLPFPSTMTDSQREAALAAVNDWQTHLEQLRAES